MCSQPNKQHYFRGFAPILETIVYERIPSIQPQILEKFSDLLIEKYGPQRKDLRPILVNLTAGEITACPWCEDGGDASPSLSTHANVADDISASKAGDVCLAEDNLASVTEGYGRLVEDV
ncbi:unnamed protein product [Trifolium pratense]|uniref:Uncharacterized protein n=1 Tax=Trifolium pratense TaxID=57577 RepID=A0ACB0KL94_TRIPR|nr:unnamed protein product [Trifolium pratense]